MEISAMILLWIISAGFNVFWFGIRFFLIRIDTKQDGRPWDISKCDLEKIMKTVSYSCPLIR